MRRRRTPSKKGVRRAPDRDRPDPPRSRALRDLEPGRGAGRPEGPHRLYLVAARPDAARAARPRPPLGLDHWRGVPLARHRRGTGDDPSRYRRDEPIPRRIGAGRRSRRARRRADGQGGWHIADELVVPANVTPVFLPPYSPELNPIERLWLYLKDNQLSHCVFDTTADIIDACCDAWNGLLTETDRIRSLCSYPWVQKVSA